MDSVNSVSFSFMYIAQKKREEKNDGREFEQMIDKWASRSLAYALLGR